LRPFVTKLGRNFRPEDRRSLGKSLARSLLYPSPMELENAIASEVSRLLAAAELASRTITERRPWWVAAVTFFRTVVL